MRGFWRALAVGSIWIAGCGAVRAADAVSVTEQMPPIEIAARLMAGSQRSILRVQIEDEWDNEQLICTPLEDRGDASGEDDDVVRRPRLRVHVGFELGSATISDASHPLLQNLATALMDPAVENDRFILAGHTDAAGSEAFNQELSERRAIAVGQFLGTLGIASDRLKLVGCGERLLLDRENPSADVNRRVEIVNAGLRD